MGTWEERMAARAHERIAAEWQRQAAEAAREQAAHEAEMAERQRAEFEAGPPGGCRECWSWAFGPWLNAYTWGHVYPAVQPGPPPEPAGPDWGLLPVDHPDLRAWCHHACHDGEPVFCGLIVFAAPG